MAAAALAVMAGHAYPVFLKFKGGKAVASFVGAFLCLTPLALARCWWCFVVVGGLDALHFHGLDCRRRHISSGGLADAEASASQCSAASVLAGAFIIYKHSSNIRRLREGIGTRFRFGARETVKNLAIIGAGSWGTALAIVLAPRFSARPAVGLRGRPGGAHALSRENDRLPSRLSACRTHVEPSATWPAPWTAPTSC